MKAICFADDFIRFLFCIQLLTGLLQGVVAITTAGFSCRVVCCGSQKSNLGTVIYTNAVPQSEQMSAVPLISGVATASLGATAQPTAAVDEQPPKYENLDNNLDFEGGDRYQRFD